MDRKCLFANFGKVSGGKAMCIPNIEFVAVLCTDCSLYLSIAPHTFDVPDGQYLQIRTVIKPSAIQPVRMEAHVSAQTCAHAKTEPLDQHAIHLSVTQTVTMEAIVKGLINVHVKMEPLDQHAVLLSATQTVKMEARVKLPTYAHAKMEPQDQHVVHPRSNPRHPLLYRLLASRPLVKTQLL